MNEANSRFYSDLQPITDFSAITQAQSFREAPSDWRIVVADIVDSTEAVAAGKYKTINMIGAACIAAATNAYDETAIAYVFGGDGATLLIPPSAVGPVSDALTSLQGRSASAFGLQLRVGVVPVKDILQKDRAVRVGKLKLSPGNNLALLAGGGFALADRLVKSPESGPRYLIGQENSKGEPDVSHLSCRWEKLTPRGGAMAALLVEALGDSDTEREAHYADALATIQSVMGELDAHAPANDFSLDFDWPPNGTFLEAFTLDGRLRPKRLAGILGQSVLQWAAHRFGLKFGDYDGPTYQQQVESNTDYRRFDDMIRLVLDCSHREVVKLRDALDDLEAEGAIRYGLHVSQQALMTCLLFDLADSRHIHFIDADEGGFTLAARQLKDKAAAAQAS